MHYNKYGWSPKDVLDPHSPKIFATDFLKDRRTISYFESDAHLLRQGFDPTEHHYYIPPEEGAFLPPLEELWKEIQPILAKYSSSNCIGQEGPKALVKK